MVIAPGTSVSGVFYCPFLMQTNMTSLQLNTKINIMYNNSDTEIIFSSNNSLEIPVLLSSMQTMNGILQPIGIWGTQCRAKSSAATWLFYVDDYRFTSLINDPAQVIRTGCDCAAEPNFSLFDSTPIAEGVVKIYRKRWIGRYWQEHGIRVYADLNVPRKFAEFNKLGIPKGYNSFATRGYSDRIEDLDFELSIAREISGCQEPNLIVYGGGKKVKEWCVANSLLYVEPFKPGVKR